MRSPVTGRMLFLLSLFAVAFTGLISAGPGAVGPGDAEALRVVAAIDRNEVKAAELALNKNVAAEVRDYAKLMQREHGENLDKTRSLASHLDVDLSADSPTVTLLQDDGAKDVDKLSPLDRVEFEAAYIQMMVQGHADALDTLTGLLNNAGQVEVKNHLRDTRQAVETHLKKARKVEGDLGL